MSPALWVLLGVLCWSIGAVGVGMLLGRALSRLEAEDIDVTSFGPGQQHVAGLRLPCTCKCEQSGFCTRGLS